MKLLPRVRFWFRFFTTRQSVNQNICNASEFGFKILQRITFSYDKFTKR